MTPSLCDDDNDDDGDGGCGGDDNIRCEALCLTCTVT